MKSKKNILVWTLVSLLFVNYIGTNFMYGLYMVDQALFIEWFCENTEDPDMHCDGSCVLDKLGDHEQHDHTHSVLEVLQVPLVFYIPTFDLELFAEPESFGTTYHYKNNYSFEFCREVTQPPILLG